ncbi:MAG TPA: virulence factor [Drouetiella sp.]
MFDVSDGLTEAYVDIELSSQESSQTIAKTPPQSDLGGVFVWHKVNTSRSNSLTIKSIETTPNPNSMKLNLLNPIAGKANTYSAKQTDGCPSSLLKLLEINGVQSIFVCNDFVTINRNPVCDWQLILDSVTRALGGGDSAAVESQRQNTEHDGQVNVFVQTFKGIPIQVKVTSNSEEHRVSLGERFNEASMKVRDLTNADFLQERYWAEGGVRYGTVQEVAQEVAEEIIGVIDSKSLQGLIDKATGKATVDTSPGPVELWGDALKSVDWSVRLRAVQEMGVSEQTLPYLTSALADAHHQVRRMAAAALGATGSDEAVAPLCHVLLHDPSVGVKRTAGDALSDLGSQLAEPSMCEALKDKSKLVRWRAARFLAEVGTSNALPFLQAAVGNEPEFEVRLEIETAIQRIGAGAEGSAPVWKRIVENNTDL